MNSNKQITKTLQIGLGVALASLLLSAVFVPFLALSVSAFVAIAVTLSVIAGKNIKRWAPTWAVGIGAAVWLVGAIYAMVIWGQAFSLSDNSQPVPLALNLTMAVSLCASVAGFATVIAATILSIVRVRRAHTVSVA